MKGKLAIVHWDDPSFEREVSDINIDFAKQINVGWVSFRGEKVLIVNSVANSDTFEVTIVHRALVTRIEPLEVKNG